MMLLWGDVNKFSSFPDRTEEEEDDDVWNGLSEDIVGADSMQTFKIKLDKLRYGDRI